jgi:hypothetical protein
MNLDYIIRLVFTHPENKGKSINSIARKLDMNPGSVYRILKRLSLVLPPKPRYCPEIPSSPFHPAKQARPTAPGPSNSRCTAMKNQKKSPGAIATPAIPSRDPDRHLQSAILNQLFDALDRPPEDAEIDYDSTIDV